MKRFVDKRYLSIAIHVVLAFAGIYAVKLIFDALAGIIRGFPDLVGGVFVLLGRALAVFSPLIVGFLVAAMLDPLAGFFQKLFERVTKRAKNNDRRTAGAVCTYVSLALVITGACVWLAVKFNLRRGTGQSLSGIINSTRNGFSDAYALFLIRLHEMGLLAFVSNYLENAFNALAAFGQGAAEKALSLLSHVGKVAVITLTGLVIGFCFLRGKARIRRKCAEIGRTFLPVGAYRLIANGLKGVGSVFSGYIRGQLTDAAIMAVLLSAWLMIVKVQFAPLIGIFSGFSNVIPYFGAFIGFALAVLDALICGEPMKALYAGIGVIVLQQIDGMYINPKIVGKSVELSSVTVITALTAAGTMFGLWGMVAAVPVCAVGKMGLTAIMRKIEAKRQARTENKERG